MNRPADMRVLLMELATAHDEVLLSYALDLIHAGAHVAIACPSVVRDRLPLPSSIPWCEALAGGSLLQRIAMAWRIRRYCIDERITHVIVITATGTTVRDVVRIIPSACTVVGVLHDLSKLGPSVNQRLTERGLDAYIVLAPHMARLASSARIPVHCVPATALPPIDASLAAARGDDELRIAIPGSMQAPRKDMALLTSDAWMRDVPQSTTFVLLGGIGGGSEDASAISAWAARHPGRVVTFDAYVPHAVVHAWMSTCDAVLPLIHPSCREYPEFLHHKITGAMSLAWAHALPLLLERGFAMHPELRQGSVFYDVHAMAQAIRSVAERRAAAPPLDADARRAALRQALAEPQRPLWRNDHG
jgi:hypothetical protein